MKLSLTLTTLGVSTKMSNSDEKFYAQRDANFKKRVKGILFDDPSGHSDEEVLELITQLRTEDNQITNLIKEVSIK